MKIIYVSLIVFAILFFFRRTQFLCANARIKYSKGETQKALKLFKIAKRIGKLDVNDRMYYGYVLLRTGDLASARETLTRASLDAKKSGIKKQIKSLLALVVWKEGDLDTAIEMMEGILEDFKNTNAYQNLGIMYILKGDFKKALEFNLEAYDYNSDDLVIMDNLAESYALCGDIENAKKFYEEILEKNPRFPEPYYSYGLLLIKEGEKERGLDLMRQALSKRFSFLSLKSKEEVEKLILENE